MPIACSVSMQPGLPDYAKRLDVWHQALDAEFNGIVAQLPLSGDEQILDAGCGDGYFTHLLAQRLSTGQVYALDASDAYLELARARLRGWIGGGQARLVQGDVRAAPFSDASLDVVWSGHSMQSYDDIPAVLSEFHRLLKPGGLLAVLETDNMHSIMLPWPPRLELALREAERRTLSEHDDRVGAYFPRYATTLFHAAGFTDVERRHTLVYRTAPFSHELRAYLRMFVEDLIERTKCHLPDTFRPLAKDFAASMASTDAGDHLYFTSLQVLMLGRTPPT